jgi:hypothetical protein
MGERCTNWHCSRTRATPALRRPPAGSSSAFTNDRQTEVFEIAQAFAIANLVSEGRSAHRTYCGPRRAIRLSWALELSPVPVRIRLPESANEGGGTDVLAIRSWYP